MNGVVRVLFTAPFSFLFRNKYKPYNSNSADS